MMNHRRFIEPWPVNSEPTGYIDNYTGPYPIGELARARRALIQAVKLNQSDIFDRVKPKLGLNSCYGPAFEPQPIDYNSPACQDYLGDQLEDNADQKQLNEQQDDSEVSVLDEGQNYQQHDSTQNRWCQDQLATSDSYGSRSFPNATQDTRNQPKNCSDHSPAVFSGLHKSPETQQPSGQLENRSSSFEMCYKCDYCSYKNTDYLNMEDHLINARHKSASQYLTQRFLSGSGRKLISVEKKLALVNTSTSKSSHVIACPSCKLVFKTIFDCGEHYQKTHDRTKAYYASCLILSEKSIAVSTKHDCLKCSVKHPSFDKLCQHWSLHMEHSPVPRSMIPGSSQVYMCKFCVEVSFMDFFSSVRHTFKMHEEKIKDVSTFDVMLLCFKVPKHIEILPPMGVVKSLESLFK